MFCAASIAKRRQGSSLLSIVETSRIASNKTVQRTVLYLGEITINNK